MASKKEQASDSIIKLENMEDLQKMVELSETKVVLIDCHLDWCGPTTAILPFYNALYMELEDPKKRIQPCTMCVKDEELVTKITPWCKAGGIDVTNQGCKPLFIVLRLGHCVGVVDGCNTAAFRMLIDLNVPKLPKKEGK